MLSVLAKNGLISRANSFNPRTYRYRFLTFIIYYTMIQKFKFNRFRKKKSEKYRYDMIYTRATGYTKLFIENTFLLYKQIALD